MLVFLVLCKFHSCDSFTNKSHACCSCKNDVLCRKLTFMNGISSRENFTTLTITIMIAKMMKKFKWTLIKCIEYSPSRNSQWNNLVRHKNVIAVAAFHSLCDVRLYGSNQCSNTPNPIWWTCLRYCSHLSYGMWQTLYEI